ncbi:hypothetical protein OKJ48_44055 [Streptomyces kunmingensis]|uniref:Uncharacterized protein n=1 Tax=Streptomyces kunmingensis TaxID=68225 RepID=A0ABU6CR55_9ACTN|nr:hypothetical protein [Streptomyces kunmingensis]MEB3967162.1 hypothetical protein [Streptomyces kunmingensis]
MTTSPEKPNRPGLQSGRIKEFTLYFHVKPGHGKLIRDVFRQPGFDERRGALSKLIGTLHDMRWVLFDDDTRLMFSTNFDGDWDLYIDDFAAQAPDIFDTILEHTEDYPGLQDPNIKDYIVAHQVTACSYFCAIPDATVSDLRKALRVQDAFQQLLDAAT